VTITLDDPDRRNALGRRMFGSLESALAGIESSKEESIPIVRLRGAGPAFCAGFDLDACGGDDGQSVLAEFIVRLSALLRRIRNGPWVAVAEVHGAALAGGNALAAACDFIVCADDAIFGYPVHRIGVSPAVNAPILQSLMGFGDARALLLSGELIDGREAQRRGLAWRSVPGASLESTVDDLVGRLIRKGPRALRATREWLNELDGSDRADRFDRSRDASLELCGGEESERMLRELREARRGDRLT